MHLHVLVGAAVRLTVTRSVQDLEDKVTTGRDELQLDALYFALG